MISTTFIRRLPIKTTSSYPSSFSFHSVGFSRVRFVCSIMEGEVGEFQDWELLPKSDAGLIKFVANSSDSVENLRELEGIERDSEGMIRSDYFSLDSYEKYATIVAKKDVSEDASVDSDNPSWIDPGSAIRFEGKDSGELWSDSSSDRSDERKVDDSELGFAGIVKNESDLVENAKTEGGLEGFGKIQTGDEDSGKVWSDSGGHDLGGLGKESELVCGGYEDSLVGPELYAGNKVDNELSMEFGVGHADSSGCDEGQRREASEGNENENESLSVKEVKASSEEEKRRVVWWKLPLEFLKYYVFRVSPIWSFSMAAAVMGFVILSRRLYRMKQKSRNLPLNVIVDDKKASQFMTRAARLNEAFSVVRRVPIIRPSLPAAGVTSWPMMSLR